MRTNRQLIEEGIDGFDAEIENLRAKAKEATSILEEALQKIAEYDCTYRCDCPNIAKKALQRFT